MNEDCCINVNIILTDLYIYIITVNEMFIPE